MTLPSLAQEAARDLVRVQGGCPSRPDAGQAPDQQAAAAPGIVWSGGTAWTGAHPLWLSKQHFDLPGLQAAYDTTLETVLLAQARRDRLDQRVAQMAHEDQWWPTVTRLQCLRGISTLTAFGVAAQVGDWTRFSGSTIGAFLGLVPTESSSGEGRSQGSITKTGNTHARRLLVEAAWHHRRPYRTTKTMLTRWDLAPAPARARGYAGNQRLHDRWVAFDGRKKRPVIANVAVARELAGWCWSLATFEVH